MQPPSFGPPSVKEVDRYFTADSDPSQEEAVIEARQTPDLVIEGPPGTGRAATRSPKALGSIKATPIGGRSVAYRMWARLPGLHSRSSTVFCT